MVNCLIIIGIAAALLVWYLICKCQKYDLKELFIKTGISLLFVILALIATFESNKFGIFNVLVIFGLVCGLVGDILLDLKYIDRERTDGYSYAGFIAFGIGHVFYITALTLNYYNGKVLFLVLGIFLDLIMSFLTIMLEKPLKLEYGKFKTISFIYALGLFGTFGGSLFLAIANNFAVMPLNLFFIGAALFAASDLILSGTYFGKGKERPIDFILNYVTYYGAQFIIAMLLLFL